MVAHKLFANLIVEYVLARAKQFRLFDKPDLYHIVENRTDLALERGSTIQQYSPYHLAEDTYRKEISMRGLDIRRLRQNIN